jgi:hypothetical protein
VKLFGTSLHQAVSASLFDVANRLCRYANESALWHSFAAMAIEATDLTFAELVYAAIEVIDKVRFLIFIRDIPYSEVHNTELLLFKRKLFAAGFHRLVIKMTIRLYQSQRAFEIAETAGGPAATAAARKPGEGEDGEPKEEGGGSGEGVQKSDVDLIAYVVGLRRR